MSNDNKLEFIETIVYCILVVMVFIFFSTCNSCNQLDNIRQAIENKK